MSKFVHKLRNLLCTLGGEGAANLRGIRDADQGHNIDVPRPRWRCTSAVASKDCPVRNMHPQPVSLVHPFSPPGHHRFEGGLEEIGIGDPVATAAATSACSRSSAVSDESRMG